MSGFASDWLSLREPYDHAARARPLLEELAAWANDRGPLAIVDLGSGTGSNLRATSPHLPLPQRWSLVEHDRRLIKAGTPGLAALTPGIEADYDRVDLALDLEAAIRPGTVLVTASAFIDLVSAAWLDRLASLVAERRAALYLTLTYDGGWRWRPGDLFDAAVKRLFDRHQVTDKGFGPALGPAATGALGDRLRAHGGRLQTCASDWRLGYADRAIQAALLDGYATAAREMAPSELAEIADWQAQRLKHIEAGRSEHRVGHQDLLWLPG